MLALASAHSALASTGFTVRSSKFQQVFFFLTNNNKCTVANDMRVRARASAAAHVRVPMQFSA